VKVAVNSYIETTTSMLTTSLPRNTPELAQHKKRDLFRAKSKDFEETLMQRGGE